MPRTTWPRSPCASMPVNLPAASNRAMRGWGDGSPGLRTFIATHTRPSGSTARAATEPSRVSSVTDHSSVPVRLERLRRPGREILLISIFQVVRCELYSPCLRKSSAVSPGPALSAWARISSLNFAGWRRRRGFSSVSGFGALVGIVMACIPLLRGPGCEAQFSCTTRRPPRSPRSPVDP